MSNLEIIEKFINKDEEKKLLICTINKEVEEFYYAVIRYFCDNKKVHLINNIIVMATILLIYLGL